MINIKSLREQVYEFLRQELASGSLLPGSPINLNEISRQLRVSKTPLRDAILQLEIEGFVTVAPRSGVFVNALTLETIRHLYEMAGGLELAAILSNLDRIDANKIATMKWLNAGLLGAVERKDFDTLYEMNLAFHNVFIDLSDNARLRRILSAAKQRLYDFPRRGYIVEWELENCKEHEMLIQALEQGDRAQLQLVWLEKHWGFAYQESYIRDFYFPGGLSESDVGDAQMAENPFTEKKRLRRKTA
ncbi:MAG: GntR family transcriptional regulator [Desulfobacteraceae bacterium]|nr:GntR family transcriptional regulator [Desulfobacteraceae bacterium]